MSRKPIAALISSSVLFSAGFVSPGSVAVTGVVATGAAVSVTGCSSDRSDARQEARVQTRTAGRVEDRRD